MGLCTYMYGEVKHGIEWCIRCYDSFCGGMGFLQAVAVQRAVEGSKSVTLPPLATGDAPLAIDVVASVPLAMGGAVTVPLAIGDAVFVGWSSVCA